MGAALILTTMYPVLYHAERLITLLHCLLPCTIFVFVSPALLSLLPPNNSLAGPFEASYLYCTWLSLLISEMEISVIVEVTAH